MKTVLLEFQYFRGCPNHEMLRRNLMQAIQGIEDRIEIQEVLVGDNHAAVKTRFRGSPTLLVNGRDIEGMRVPTAPTLTCRFYRNGLPSAETIRSKIEDAYAKD